VNDTTPSNPETPLAQAAHEFILERVEAFRDEPLRDPGDHPLYQRLENIGTRLWMDTGSFEESEALWTRQFSALTTNNTLLSREVRAGTYDELVPAAARRLAAFDLSPRRLTLEIAFILNALHGLRLVKRYDAYVSVEEHTDLAGDVQAAVATGQRFHRLCPERFIVKIPLTPAGILATRRLSDAGVPVNHTLGFSARQNLLVARLARPAYVNVFLGRLNSVVKENGLGDGRQVGERATLASQAHVRSLRGSAHSITLQIGASFRSGSQVADLAGIDVMTLPPKVVREAGELGLRVENLQDRTGHDCRTEFSDISAARRARIDTLWDVSDSEASAAKALSGEPIETMDVPGLLKRLDEAGCGDVLVEFNEELIARSRSEGKIPRLENWRDELGGGHIGLDTLMNLAGLNAFRADQQEMDEHVNALLSGT
jgi:transaldolase